MPFISSVAGSGSKFFFRKENVVLTVPGPVQNLTLTAGDRTITATWDPPASNGGSAITSYTVETQLNTDAWVSQGSQSSGVSFTVRNNTAYAARSYKVRVTANNSVGAGSATTSSSATPAFGTPATPTLALEPGFPSTAYETTSSTAPTYRPLRVTYSPLACSGFSEARIFMLTDAFTGLSAGYTDVLNGNNPFKTTSSTANQTLTVGSIGVWNTSTGVYDNKVPSHDMLFRCRIRTYNSDGDYVDSPVSADYTTTAQQSRVVSNTTWNWSGESFYSASTGVFTVTGNTFTQTSVYSIPGVNTSNNYDTQYRITNVTINARTGSSGTTICTSSRYFFADFSGTSTSAGTGGGSRNGLSAPWSTNSGTTYRASSTGWGVGYGNAGAGRLRVRGAGSIGTWSTSPDQRIYVYMDIEGWSRQMVPTTTNTTYYY